MRLQIPILPYLRQDELFRNFASHKYWPVIVLYASTEDHAWTDRRTLADLLGQIRVCYVLERLEDALIHEQPVFFRAAGSGPGIAQRS